MDSVRVQIFDLLVSKSMEFPSLWSFGVSEFHLDAHFTRCELLIHI